MRSHENPSLLCLFLGRKFLTGSRSERSLRARDAEAKTTPSTDKVEALARTKNLGQRLLAKKINKFLGAGSQKIISFMRVRSHDPIFFRRRLGECGRQQNQEDWRND